MSICFQEPVNEETRRALDYMVGPAVAKDEKTFLYDGPIEIHGSVLSELARKAGQTVTLAVHNKGETMTLSDGTRYQATEHGWVEFEEADELGHDDNYPFDSASGEVHDD